MLSGTVRYVGEETRRIGDELDNSRKSPQRVTGRGRRFWRGATPSPRPTVLLSAPAMHQDLDSPPSPWSLTAPRGRTGIRSRTGKPQHPASPVSRPDLFQSSSFEDTLRKSLPCMAFSRWAFRFSAAAGPATRPLQAAGPLRERSHHSSRKPLCPLHLADPPICVFHALAHAIRPVCGSRFEALESVLSRCRRRSGTPPCR